MIKTIEARVENLCFPTDSHAVGDERMGIPTGVVVNFIVVAVVSC